MAYLHASSELHGNLIHQYKAGEYVNLREAVDNSNIFKHGFALAF